MVWNLCARGSHENWQPYHSFLTVQIYKIFTMKSSKKKEMSVQEIKAFGPKRLINFQLTCLYATEIYIELTAHY